MRVSETPDSLNTGTHSSTADPTLDSPLVFGTHELKGRLVVGTGKYNSYELMQECLEASGAEVVTVAIRRERLVDSDGRNILDFIDLSHYTILPNTAGCFTAEDAVAFEEGYTTPKLLSQTHGASWQALVRRLRDAGIKPFVGKRGAFGNVYLREAIDRILR